jgi:hypothetical protein
LINNFTDNDIENYQLLEESGKNIVESINLDKINLKRGKSIIRY